MNYTNTQALAYRIAEAIYKNGPMAATDIVAAFAPEFTERAVLSKIGRMCFEADLERIKDAIQLRTHLRRHFAEKYADKSDVAQTRTSSSFKPWSGKFSIARPDLRDWGYKNGSTDFKSFVGFQV